MLVATCRLVAVFVLNETVHVVGEVAKFASHLMYSCPNRILNIV